MSLSAKKNTKKLANKMANYEFATMIFKTMRRFSTYPDDFPQYQIDKGLMKKIEETKNEARKVVKRDI